MITNSISTNQCAVLHIVYFTITLLLHIVYFTITLLLHVSAQLPSSGSLHQRC